MLRHFLLLTLILPIISTITACSWILQPTILLLTRYQEGEYQNSYDQIVYSKLAIIYGKNNNITLFSNNDDNYYAVVLHTFLSTYNIRKVFILNPSFQKYLPHSSKWCLYVNNNLVRMLQWNKFKDVKFYFFNNIIADSIKNTTNIYDIRFNTSNNANPSPPTYWRFVNWTFYWKCWTRYY